MDLDDMKQAWSSANHNKENQSQTDKKLLRQITHEQSNNRLNRIVQYELLGQVINWGLIVYIFSQWQKLDSLYLQSTALIMVAITFFFSYSCYQLYQKITVIDIQKNSLIEVLKAVSQFKRFYYQYKRMTIFLMAIGLSLWVPIIIKLLHNNNLLEHLQLYTVPILIGVALGFGLLFFTYKKLHEKNIQEVENLLLELENLD